MRHPKPTIATQTQEQGGTGPLQRGGRSVTVALALALILAGLAVNPLSVGWTLAPDGQISDPWKIASIVLFELALVALGVSLLLRRRAPRHPLLAAVAAGGLLLCAAFAAYQTAVPLATLSRAREQARVLEAINRSEDLIQEITTWLGDWKHAALNLRFPDSHARGLFEEQVEVRDLVPAVPEPTERVADLVVGRSWPVAEASRSMTRDGLDLWRPLFERVDWFEHAKFYVVRGEFHGRDEFASEMGFSGLARLRSGAWAEVSAHLDVLWADHTPAGAERPLWRVRAFHTRDLQTVESERLLFDEVLDLALPDPDARERARRSLHEDLVVRKATDPDWTPPKWFTTQSHDRHPGLAVADVDGDGWDDLYLVERWGENLLFRNLGDGTFEEVAADLGLDIEGRSSCALFADFDNDGDLDLVLGRTLERSQYLENKNGRFVDRSERMDAPLPYLVSSISAVDYDLDGLLDLYFATYAARMIHQQVFGRPVDDVTGEVIGGAEQGLRERLLEGYLADEEARELARRYHGSSHPFLDRAGPPNRLYKNLGEGGFEIAAGGAPLEVWRNTYQSTWSDFDRDGDPDVYVANDFAPNNFLRNEGRGRFVDVTDQTGTADVGFGMGAAFGDYNNDGTQDLYVTNMFSKAGRRITSQIAELDPLFAQCARGNSLFRLDPARGFEKVSGLEPPALTVEKAGWSWGGQFLDVDNDGWLDVHALSGHYTAPDEIAIPVDT